MFKKPVKRLGQENSATKHRRKLSDLAALVFSAAVEGSNANPDKKPGYRLASEVPHQAPTESSIKPDNGGTDADRGFEMSRGSSFENR